MATTEHNQYAQLLLEAANELRRAYVSCRPAVVEECAKRCDAIAEFVRLANVNAKATIHVAEQCAAEIRKLACEGGS